MKLSNYACGIAYATGYMVNENGKSFLVVRNIDKWYADIISVESQYNPYRFKRSSKGTSWCIKARDVSVLPELSTVIGSKDFIRAYIEIHGILDTMNFKNRRGEPLKKLRLRIYGKKEILEWINEALPAGIKKIQYIKNIVDSDYVGETYCIYFQSQAEIEHILGWIDGQPRNENVWYKWKILEKNLKSD